MKSCLPGKTGRERYGCVESVAEVGKAGWREGWLLRRRCHCACAWLYQAFDMCFRGLGEGVEGQVVELEEREGLRDDRGGCCECQVREYVDDDVVEK